ncbi:MAG: DNA recombination protein RmuC [Bacteroidota bacterium]|nr:DNA recombination protein RmuC [Bacteroidota bacterium]MDP3146519.1 DNA recombination protein RmuC [Bacteroidota bacterium]
MEILLYIIIALLVVVVILQFVMKPKSAGDNSELNQKLDTLDKGLSKIESNLKEDFKTNREENAKIARENREELNNALKEINKTLAEKVESLIGKIDENNKSNRAEISKNIKELIDSSVLQLDKINNQTKDDNKSIREALSKAFTDFGTTFDKNVESFNNLQREKFAQLEIKQNELVKGTETKLESIRVTVEEKLEKTLSERLGQSFETVGKQLIEVQKGLGEMQTLAQDVGGLKKVLSNVKMRGGIGEVQLAMLLEQVLAPEQYEANVKTKQGSGDLVEFAIKLPGRDDGNSVVWLPIDAKFPKDVYEQLQTAHDTGDIAQIDIAQKNLENTIKKMAKDIHDKYIDPPNTTDFGIMFLPFEGIYAEVVRKASLLEDLQRNYKIIVTGPTTLAAILNSLQMGFKTLAIQKRSSEVWKVLGAVKTEFEKFGGLMQKAQTNIQTGLNQLDDAIGTRTRAIQRTLKGVEALTQADTKLILPEGNDNKEEEPFENDKGSKKDDLSDIEF